MKMNHTKKKNPEYKQNKQQKKKRKVLLYGPVTAIIRRNDGTPELDPTVTSGTKRRKYAGG